MMHEEEKIEYCDGCGQPIAFCLCEEDEDFGDLFMADHTEVPVFTYQNHA